MYTEIINKVMTPFVRKTFNENVQLHQDNDPKHNSKLCQEFYSRNQINWIRSPPNSPDLNPIERLFNQMKSYVRKRFCRSVYEISNAVNDFE